MPSVQQAAERPPDGETGTTLVELMVIIVLLAFVGSITTAGIVRGFNAQLAATDVAETLDGMRIATQRVRDFIRGADEVCANSNSTRLVLWTDDDDDSIATDEELDIFEVVVDAGGNEVFQRSVPGSGEVQLIRDDILNTALFVFDDDPAKPATDQPITLSCNPDGSGLTGVSEITSVTVEFQVEHPDPAQLPLATSTQVRVRNAALLAPPNDAPTASFTVDCPPLSDTCSFDASASTDEDGVIVSYLWDFGDGNTTTGVTTTNQYATADPYQVTLTVVDDFGAVDVATETAQLNLQGTPTADFTIHCDGRICDFDASPSSDDGTIVSYDWQLGDGNTATGPLVDNHNYGADGTYAVTLTVTDNEGLDDSITRTITASATVMRVGDLTASVTGSGTYRATFTIAVTTTAGSNPGAGVTVSMQAFGGKVRTESCSTDSSGKCTVQINGIPGDKEQSVLVTSLSDSGGVYTHDDDQDVVDQIIVDNLGQVTKYKDGAEVTP